MDDSSTMAACGLECRTCPLRLAPSDPDAARTVVAWFQGQGWLAEGEGMEQVLERRMYCTGCHGARNTHWSADCWILACCVDRRGHDHCAQCEDFPCDRLVEWAQGNEGYAIALARLRDLRTASA